MEPGVNKARQAELRARLHLYRQGDELQSVLDAIRIFKAECDDVMRSTEGADVHRAQGGWAKLDQLETWITTATPVVPPR